MSKPNVKDMQWVKWIGRVDRDASLVSLFFIRLS